MQTLNKSILILALGITFFISACGEEVPVVPPAPPVTQQPQGQQPGYGYGNGNQQPNNGQQWNNGYGGGGYYNDPGYAYDYGYGGYGGNRSGGSVTWNGPWGGGYVSW